MTRKNKDIEWALKGDTFSVEQAILAVMMDLRDELKEIKDELKSWQRYEARQAIRRIDKRLQQYGLLLKKK